MRKCSITRHHLTTTSATAISTAAAAFAISAGTPAYAASPLCDSTSTNANLEWVTRVGINGVDINVAPNTEHSPYPIIDHEIEMMVGQQPALK